MFREQDMRFNENTCRTSPSPTLRDQLLRKLVESRSGQLIFASGSTFVLPLLPLRGLPFESRFKHGEARQPFWKRL